MLFSFVTSAALMAVKLASLEMLVAKWDEHSRLKLELDELLADEATVPLASAPLAPSHFLAQPAVPPIPAANLANVAYAPAPEPVVVRGMCDGCGTNVMSNHDGRKKQGQKYYHIECFRGYCAICEQIVHAASDRVRVGNSYQHRDCV
jgi:hypothetical protein